MKYRAEIDGLRALAVVPVILFHAGFKIFSGGFVGVDVFFVISGYLITTILLEDLEDSRFSLLKFYERRARRLMPALFVVLLACLPFAWLWMPPSLMKDFSQSLTFVSLFSSNILFWHETGYFDTVAELKPLLHTWSLAVEEQFYLIFPIFLLFAWRFVKQRLLWIFISIVLISLLLSEWGWREFPEANFFMAHTRAWELLFGSISALFLRRRKIKSNCVLSLLGFALILIATFTFDKNTPFPSLYGLLPVSGTMLIILFTDKNTVVGRLLSLKPVVGVGLISYSAYLWHQPIFAFTRIYMINQPSAALMLTLSASSMALAFVSWKFVEQPFRDREKIRARSIFIVTGIGLFLFASLGVVGHYTNGFSSLRFSQQELNIIEISKLKSKQFKILGDKTKPATWMLLGDSHAESLQEATNDLLIELETSGIVHTKHGCPPALNLWAHQPNYGRTCHNHYAKALSLIEDHQIRHILLNARFSLYLNSNRFDNGQGGRELGVVENVIHDHIGYKNVIRDKNTREQAVKEEFINYVKSISKLGVSIYLISSIPEIGWDVPKAAYKNRGSQNEIKIQRTVFDARNASQRDLLENLISIDNVHILKPEDVFCDEDFCYATRNGKPLYFDTNHLSKLGGQILLDYFKSTLKEK